VRAVSAHPTLDVEVDMAYDVRPPAREATLPRVLVAVHGQEPAAWVAEAVRAVPRPAELRIVTVLDTSLPAFTSLLPAARRRHAAAVAAWRRTERARVSESLDALLGALPAHQAGAPDVRHLEVPDADPARAIAEHAAAWAADLLVVGRDAPPRAWRLALGAVHERVLRSAGCAVLVAGRDPAAARRRAPAAVSPRFEAGA
jgi:nucleotide-binding universal stress UspA family protein